MEIIMVSMIRLTSKLEVGRGQMQGTDGVAIPTATNQCRPKGLPRAFAKMSPPAREKNYQEKISNHLKTKAKKKKKRILKVKRRKRFKRIDHQSLSHTVKPFNHKWIVILIYFTFIVWYPHVELHSQTLNCSLQVVFIFLLSYRIIVLTTRSLFQLEDQRIMLSSGSNFGYLMVIFFRAHWI